MSFISKVNAKYIIQIHGQITYNSWVKKIDEGESPTDYEDIIEEFLEFTHEDLREKDPDKALNIAVKMLKQEFARVMKTIPTRFPLTIYRGMEISNENKLKPKKIGLHWTTVLDTAENTNRFCDVKSNIVYKTEVRKNDIDWVETIRHRIVFPMEKEIRLNQNIPLTLSGYRKCGDKKWINCNIKVNTGK